jgi:hypothetical protein
MPAQIIRRIYLYLAAFIGLQMAAGGIGSLITFLAEYALEGAAISGGTTFALRLGSGVALTLVGLLFWFGHWTFAERDAQQPEGQHSALRRLYAYAVLFVAAMLFLTNLQSALSVLLTGLAENQALIRVIGPLTTAIISAVIWIAHWRIFSRDRALVEQGPPNATLRRWYLALTLWISLAMLSFGAGTLLHGLLQRFVFSAAVWPQQVALPAAALISGLALWLPHEYWSRQLIRTPGPLRDDELRSTLRQVYAALVITASLIAALTGLTALLSAVFRAMLGAATWMSALQAETRGGAAVLVATPILFYYREQLLISARLSGASERSATARRIVSYLVGAVSLVALYVGLGGLIGTLLRIGLAPAAIGAAWQIPLSWYAATAVVALPVYGLMSRSSERAARSDPDEQRVLARRLYLYGGLLFGVIASVVTTTQLIQQIIVALSGQGAAGLAGEIGRLAAYTLIGGAIAATYALLVRQAGAVRGTFGAGCTILIVSEPPLCQMLEAALSHELPGARLLAYTERDSPERRAALAEADLLILPLAVLHDPALKAFSGPTLLLATPIAGRTLIGAHQSGPDLAQEAARTARKLITAQPPARYAQAPGMV